MAARCRAASATRRARRATGPPPGNSCLLLQKPGSGPAGVRPRFVLGGHQLLVSAVAERLAGGVLAAAQPQLLRFGDAELLRRELRALVRAVAEGLALRAAAGAPPVVSRGELHGEGRALRDQRVRHAASSLESRIKRH